MRSIQIQPDTVAIIADRLARRLRRDGLACNQASEKAQVVIFNAIVEALADELHSDIIDRMLNGGGR